MHAPLHAACQGVAPRTCCLCCLLELGLILGWIANHCSHMGLGDAQEPFHALISSWATRPKHDVDFTHFRE